MPASSASENGCLEDEISGSFREGHLLPSSVQTSHRKAIQADPDSALLRSNRSGWEPSISRLAIGCSGVNRYANHMMKEALISYSTPVLVGAGVVF